MMPIVFCASLVPCPRLYAAADANCNLRNRLSTEFGAVFFTIHRVPAIIRKPRIIPISGDSTMKINVFVQPEAMMTPSPLLATALPA